METPSRAKLISVTLVLLAIYVAAGATAGLIALTYAYRRQGLFAFSFLVHDQGALNNVFTIIGCFHAGFAFALTRLNVRIGAQIRTRAVLKNVAPDVLLNTLPDSPRRTTLTTRLGLLLTISTVITAIITIITGVVYKRGFFLGTENTTNTTSYPIEYITTCTPLNFTDCNVNLFAFFGTAIQFVLKGNNGTPFTLGVQRIDADRRRVIITSIPLMPKDLNMKKVSGEVLAVIGEYQDVTSSPPAFTQSWTGATISVRVGYSGDKWMFDNDDGQTIIGDIKWCKISCDWEFNQGDMTLNSCDVENARCGNTTNPLWISNAVKWQAPLYAYAIFHDYYGRNMNRLLDSGFIIATMFTAHVLGSGEVYNPLIDTLLADPNTKHIAKATSLEFQVDSEHMVIISNHYAAVYIITLLATAIVLLYCGYVDKKVWMTTWAPVYMSIMGIDRVRNIISETDGGLKSVKIQRESNLLSKTWPPKFHRKSDGEDEDEVLLP
ncbi:hypothetical protein BDD12DRAFT_807889 [Trichophaea hybrida]|nr:hypothetical protein BDD12DRAFT_807889 [Trichophaea hybrida]